MPYARCITIWRVTATKLTVSWMYGRVIDRNVNGEITAVRVTLDNHTRLRDWAVRHSSTLVHYYDTYQAAVEFLQSCILERAKILSDIWKKSLRQEHGRGITKTRRI